MTRKNIKICHFTSVHKRHDVRIFRKECLSLSKRFQVFLVVADGLGNEEREGVQIIDVGKITGGRLTRFRKTSKKVAQKALALDAAIYHFHDPELLFYATAFFRKNKKLIYDVHEDVPRQILAKYWIPGIFRKTVATFFEWYENHKAARMNFVVAATPFIRDRFLKVNKNTIDINNFPISDVIIEDSGIAPKENAVCYVGGITKVRGVGEVVEALEQVDVQLKLAGEISPAEFESELKSKKGWAKVDFAGFVDRNRIRGILQASKAGIVTLYPIKNYIDALPVKMFEYMAAGLPVIASHFPLWKEIIEGNNCGLTVDPKNPQEIAAAIKHVLDNPEIARKMGENGQKAVMEKYNWKEEEKKLFDVYEIMAND